MIYISVTCYYVTVPTSKLSGWDSPQLTLHLEVYDAKAVAYNYGQNIVDKFTKFSKKGFSLECFTVDFGKFLAQLPKLGFLMADWGTDINSKPFRDFLKFFLIS